MAGMGVPLELGEIAGLLPGRYNIQALARAANRGLAHLGNGDQVPGLAVEGQGPTGRLLTRRFAEQPDGGGVRRLVLVRYNPGEKAVCASTDVVSSREETPFTEEELKTLARTLAELVVKSLS